MEQTLVTREQEELQQFIISSVSKLWQKPLKLHFPAFQRSGALPIGGEYLRLIQKRR